MNTGPVSLFGIVRYARDMNADDHDPPPDEALPAAVRGRIEGLERRLRALEAEHAAERRLIEHAADAFIVHDHDGRFVDCNTYACRLLGYDRETLLTLSLSDLEPDFNLFGIREHWKAMRLGQGVTVEGRPRHRDGSMLNVEVRLSLIDDTPGARRYLAVLRDLREREAPLEALRRSQLHFRQVVEHAGEPFFLHDVEGRIRDVNRRAGEALGHSRDDLLGACLLDFADEAGAAALRAAWAAMQPDDTHTLELDFRRADGATCPVEIRVGAVEREGERLFLCFAHDISDRRRLEEERAEKARALARANEELEQFTRVASHDLQAPLRKVRTFAEMLADDFGEALGADGLDYVEVLTQCAEGMQQLIRDLLDFARVGGEAACFAEVDLDELLDAVLWDLSVEIEEHGGAVERAPLPRVQGDVMQLRQLLQNLVCNAIKYRHPDRAPAVRVTAQVEADGRTCVLRVADNGRGFDAADAARIFEPFRRLHQVDGCPGTGMGLAICQRIAERHGGSIHAEGRVGEGATFTVRLPLRR